MKNDIHSLPESLQDIAETIGLRLTLLLVREYGGTEIKFPKNPHSSHPVVIALGKDDALAICSYFGGNAFYVPHMRPPKSVRPEVIRLQEEGKARHEIARQLGVSQRHVRRMANKTSDPDQFNFFDDPDTMSGLAAKK